MWAHFCEGLDLHFKWKFYRVKDLLHMQFDQIKKHHLFIFVAILYMCTYTCIGIEK